MALVAAALAVAPLARAAINSTGDVKPPFALADTIGSTKTFTVPPDGSTQGGVVIGDAAPGTLTMDNGWTLNATYGIVANQAGSGSPSASQFTMVRGSRWIGSGDFDLGRAATATSLVDDAGTFTASGQFRLGTLAGAGGVMNFTGGSSMNVGSLVVGVGGAGSLTVGGSTVMTQFIEVGRQVTGDGQLILNAADFTSTGGLTIGVAGHGALSAGSGTTLTTDFANFGFDFDAGNAPSSLATSQGVGTVSGAGAVWHNAQGLGVAFNSRGSLAISAGATVTSGFVEVSRFGSDGALTVDDATLTMARTARFAGTPSLIIATEAGSAGRATFTGDGTAVTVSDGGFVEVGRHGNGDLTVSAGADVRNSFTILATEAGATGKLTLSGGGTTWRVDPGGVLEVGRFGNGTLSAAGGAAIVSPSGRIAIGGSSVSSASLVDAGTTWTTAAELEVGGAGAGSLWASEGATVTVGTFLYVGSTGGSGTLDVAGPNSLVTSGNQIIVSNGGTAAVTVRNGGLLDTKKGPSPTLTSGLIGRFAGGEGTVTVTGTGSKWTGDGGVNVGFAGKGTLRIEEGGRVDCVDGVLARLPGSTGVATLSGAGSTWVIGNALYVGGRPASGAQGVEGQAGPGGVATLTVGAGSAVRVGNALHLFDAGTIDLTGGGTLTVGAGAAGSAGTLRVNGGASLVGSGTIKGDLRVDPGGAVDVSNGKLTLTGTPVSTVRQFLVNGYAGGSWAGTGGINSSAAAADGSTAVGYASGADGVVPGLAGDSIRVRYTKSGDATLDGVVDFSDLVRLAQNYNTNFGASTDSWWIRGDFNYDGVCDFGDLVRLAQNYNTSLPADPIPGAPADFAGDLAAAFAAAVPEPATTAFLPALLLVSGASRGHRRGWRA